MRIIEVDSQYQPILKIGRISIGRSRAGGFFLHHDSGKGIRLSEDAMVQMIEKVFNEVM